MLNRRSFLLTTAATGALALSKSASLAAERETHRYKIGVCDWMILKRQKLGAISLAKEIDVDGLELDMGSLGQRDTFENALVNSEFRKQFQNQAVEQGIEICSIAMSGFYAQSFAKRPTYKQMLGDCIDTMIHLDVKIGFLPLGVQGDLNVHPELRPSITSRLKEVGQMATAAGVVIGIETALDAAGEVQLLEAIGSPAIRSYFNFANALQNGRDLLTELRTLGKDHICQIHCTDEDGVWLKNNKRLDMPAVKQTLDDMGWSGWLVIERSRDAQNAHDVRGNYGANARYLKTIFQPA
jgi:sugar phosphate isomerase/epimerase